MGKWHRPVSSVGHYATNEGSGHAACAFRSAYPRVARRSYTALAVVECHFLQFLIERSERKPPEWDEIDRQEPDDEPLSEEELRQLKSDAGYVSGEDAKRAFGLQVDLP